MQLTEAKFTNLLVPSIIYFFSTMIKILGTVVNLNSLTYYLWKNLE